MKLWSSLNCTEFLSFINHTLTQQNLLTWIVLFFSATSYFPHHYLPTFTNYYSKLLEPNTSFHIISINVKITQIMFILHVIHKNSIFRKFTFMQHYLYSIISPSHTHSPLHLPCLRCPGHTKLYYVDTVHVWGFPCFYN